MDCLHIPSCPVCHFYSACYRLFSFLPGTWASLLSIAKIVLLRKDPRQEFPRARGVHDKAGHGYKLNVERVFIILAGQEAVHTQVNTDQWITLNEASILTGRSMDTLRTMIRRGKLTRVKKDRGKRGDEWVIHREAVLDPGQAEQPG